MNMVLGLGEVRLIDILPCAYQAIIKCEVRIVALSARPVYEAISYRWGDIEHRKTITVNNQETFVTCNLHAALLRLRRQDEKRTIWIDQLCIDQSNIEERIAQIRLMRQIYSDCSQCIIWMEEINDNIPQADAESAIDVLKWMASRGLSAPPCLYSSSTFHGTMKALKSIGVEAHPWWTRIWTVQEAILPSRKLLLWGPLHIPWEILTRAADVWTGASTNSAEVMNVLRYRILDSSSSLKRTMGWLFCNVIWVNSAHNMRDLPLQAAMKWRGRIATEPRDKIFGLLGLLPPDMELRFTDRCGYTTSIAELYSAFTLDLILDAEGLLPLAVEPRNPDRDGAGCLPGWVFDMDFETVYRVDIFYRYWGYDSYDACAGRELDKPAIENTLGTGSMRALGLTGVMIDTIELTGSRVLQLQVSQAAADEAEVIARTMQSWMSMAREYHASLDGGLRGAQFEEAFYRALVSDRIRNSEQWVLRRPNDEDVVIISEFVRTGFGLLNGTKVWDRHMYNQTFFLTKSGIMGLGHLQTELEDQVWVFDGGKMPFTIRPRKGGTRDDFDFVGCCYAYSCMDGEIYRSGKCKESQKLLRKVQLY